MLQVFVDDSGRGENQENPVFLLAGYAGRVRNWEAAADALQRIMRKSPKLEYLKGKEAASLTGNFAGWRAEQRDSKLREMIAVLKKYRMIAVSFGVSYKDFNRFFAEAHGINKTPYAIIFCHMVVWMLMSAFKKPSRESIELIFDQGVIGRERHIQNAYEGLMGFIPSEMTGLLVGRPRFEDDRKVLPLQMADLLAWHSRRDYYEQTASRGTRRWGAKVWDELRKIQGKALFLRTPELINLNADLAKSARLTLCRKHQSMWPVVSGRELNSSSLL